MIIIISYMWQISTIVQFFSFYFCSVLALLSFRSVFFKLFLVTAHSEVLESTAAHLELLHQTHSSAFT